jgi:tRNA 2-selenouridine synthase
LKIISPQEWFQLSDAPPLLDVRSPGEYEHGHWPGAHSLPLFDNDERAEVGTLYKQQSPDVAFLRGLELAGHKMRWYVEEARRLAPNGKVAIHCWRGGQRSQSMGWLLSKTFAEVTVLEGGYKALRNAGRSILADLELPLIVLGGATGSSKTAILHALQAEGETLVDLEQMAHHKGSAFGALGEEEQPTVEQFENDLFKEVIDLSYSTPNRVWLEDESKAIGRVYLPTELWEKKQQAPLILLNMPLEWRVGNLVKVYADYDKQGLAMGFERIKKRLGGQHLKTALEALEKDDFATAAAIALVYYDKAYNWSLERSGRKPILTLKPASNDPTAIAKELLAALASITK